MTAIYIFAFTVGTPLVLWFAFGGGDGDGGDADGGVFSLVSIGTVAFALAFFGATGIVSQWFGAGLIGSLILALVVGVVASLLNSAAFAWLADSEVSSEVTNSELEGTMATVALELSETQRGKIVLDVAGSRSQMTAQLVSGEEMIQPGARVRVVRIEAGVALVSVPDIK